MRQPYLIPGESGGSFQSVPTKQHPSQIVRILAVVWLLAGIGFALWKFAASKDRPTPITPPPATARVTAISTEDLLHHADAVSTSLNEAAARLRRSEDQITRSVPGIERNYLFV